MPATAHHLPRRIRGERPRRHRRRLLGALAALIALAGPLAAAPAYATSTCLVVEPESVVWATGPQQGGFLLNLELRNICQNPVSNWKLALQLAPGHTASTGWNADWTLDAQPLTATPAFWQPVLRPGRSLTLGLLGNWSGSYADLVACTINGRPCDGSQPNQPPQVVMTSPADGGLVIFPGTVTLAADATDPDGAVDRVEFYLDDELAGTDDTAPYQLTVPLSIPFCSCQAYARAFDDGDPALSADAEPVNFAVVSVPPAPYTVNPTALEVPEGGAAAFRVQLTAPTTVSFGIRVEGDPGIAAAPETFVLNGATLGQDVTVTAAAGTAPASAVVWVDAFPNPTAVLVTVVSP
jgi:cellulose binding protein with CBM2 domain/Big-like domain-containing protein